MAQPGNFCRALVLADRAAMSVPSRRVRYVRVYKSWPRRLNGRPSHESINNVITAIYAAILGAFIHGFRPI